MFVAKGAKCGNDKTTRQGFRSSDSDDPAQLRVMASDHPLNGGGGTFHGFANAKNAASG